MGGGSDLTLAAPFPEDPEDPVDTLDPLDPVASSKHSLFIKSVVTFDPGGHSGVIFFLTFFDPSHADCFLLDPNLGNPP